MDRVSQLFNTAQRLFGYEHVLLTSIVYSGQRCSDSRKDSFWSCGDEPGARGTRTGIGALVGVPLVGGGAGHGRVDWWPRFETRSAAEVYLEYEHSAYQWSQLLTKYGKTSGAATEQRRLGLLSAARALEQLLNRAVSPHQDPDSRTSSASDRDDQEEWPIFLRECVRELIGKLLKLNGETGTLESGSKLAPALLRDVEQPEKPSNTPAGTPETTSAPAEPPTEVTSTASATSLSIAIDEHVKEAGRVAYTIEAAAEELDGLWNVYRQLAHVSAPQGRHRYLLGPAVVIPLQDVKREWFYGMVLEVGRPWFRLTISGGFRASYDNRWLVAPTGWFAGIGLSGEFADDLFHLANGARDAGNRLHAELYRAKGAP